MTVEQANKKLIIARKKKGKITEEIKALINFIYQNKRGAHLTIEKRNKEIHIFRLKGMSYKQIALHCNLSTTQIRNICLRMEKQKKEKIVEAWIERNSK